MQARIIFLNLEYRSAIESVFWQRVSKILRNNNNFLRGNKIAKRFLKYKKASAERVVRKRRSGDNGE